MAEGLDPENELKNDQNEFSEGPKDPKSKIDDLNKNANELLKGGKDAFKDMSFDRIVHLIKEGVGVRRIAAVKHIRESLDKYHDDVISCNVVADLVDCLKDDEGTSLQFEAAWALTNLASGTADDTKAVVEGGAIPRLIQLIESPSDKVREQVIWALGNIVGDGPQHRDLLLDYGIVISLSGIVGNVNEIVIVRRQASWVFSNLCRHKASPLSDQIFSEILPVFCKALDTENDDTCLHELCWGISYITDSCTPMRMQIIINSNIFTKVIDLLRRYNTKEVTHPAIRAVGNLSTCDDDQTQQIINLGALPVLGNLLNHEAEIIRKEVCWTLSNIAAGTLEQKIALKDEGIIPKMTQMINDDEVIKVRREIMWVICNMVEGFSDEITSYMIEHGAVQSLKNFLDFPDARSVVVALEGLTSVLRHGEKRKQEQELSYNSVAIQVNNLLIRDRLEVLIEHDNHDISDKAQGILDRYLREEEGGEGEEGRDDNFVDDVNSNLRY